MDIQKTIRQRIETHILLCRKCSSGGVATLKCPWMKKLYLKNYKELSQYGDGVYLEELD